MKRTTLGIISIIGTLIFALPVMAQDENSGVMQPQAAKVVQQGNTTMVFEPAGAKHIDKDRLLTWGKFAEGHPKVAKDLAYNSSLMNDPAYLSKHPSLSSFFRQHPGVKHDMAMNPGNFDAIPPRPGE